MLSTVLRRPNKLRLSERYSDKRSNRSHAGSICITAEHRPDSVTKSGYKGIPVIKSMGRKDPRNPF